MSLRGRETPVRICYVLPTFRLGGTEKQVLALSRRIRPGFEPIFVCLKEARDLAQWAQVPQQSVFEAGMRGGKDLAVLGRLRSLLKAIRPDIVHTFLFDANVWGVLAARWAGVPLIVSSRRSVDFWQKRRHIWMERLSNRCVKAITANSKAVLSFTSQQEGVPEHRLRLIYNGVDTEAFRPTQGAQPRTWFPEASGPVIGMVATLFSEKRHDLFLSSAQAILKQGPGCRFLVVGDGPSRSQIETRVRDMGLGDQVILTGELKDPAVAYAEMDILVLCSDREGFSNAILEAMACGLPVVATDVGGNKEAVIHGRTGLIVPCGDLDALSSALLELVRSRDLRRSMGERGRQRIEQEFSLDRAARDHMALYWELLAHSKSPAIAPPTS